MLKRKQIGKLNDLGFTMGFIAVAAIVVYFVYTYQTGGLAESKISTQSQVEVKK